MFGKSTPSTGGGGSSLFGSLNTNQNNSQPATTGSSLFSGLNSGTTNATNTNQAAPTTSLFSGLSGTTLNQSTSNPEQSSQSSGLFGNTTGGQQQQSQPSSLFGSTANTTGGQQRTQNSGLFGATGSTLGQPQQQQQQSSGLFGATTTTLGQPQQQQSTGLFGAAGSTLGQQKQEPQTGNAFGATANQAASTNGYFDSLLAQSKKQGSGESPLGDLPSLQLGLGDLGQRVRKFGRQTNPLQAGKAHHVLAASGVDPGAAVRDLKSFNIQNGGRVERPAPGMTSTDIDVEAYLANLQTKTTLSMIADGLERSARDFDNFLEDNITMEWEAQRRKIYEHFGISTKADGDGPGRDTQGAFGKSRRNPKASRAAGSTVKGSAFGRSNLQKSVIGTPSKIGPHRPEFTDVESPSGGSGALNHAAPVDDRYLREKQGKLAERVKRLNEARIQNTPYPILHELAEVETNTGDRHAQQLVDAYHAATFIAGESHDADTFAGGATSQERRFKNEYMDINDKSRASIDLRKRILDGANRYLEKKFFEEVDSVIARYPREAALGGRPDVISKIQAYVRLRNSRKDLVPDNVELQEVDGEFVWAIVFYLLRSGHVDEAAHYVNSRSTTFRSIDRTFAAYLLEYVSSPERRLRRQLQDRCNNEYNQRARNAPENSIDPYRMACYKIVGRCDITNRSLDGLNTEIEDWVWLQFNLAREIDKSTEIAGESYGLQELRTSIRDIGLKHFPKNPAEDKNGTFGMFFYLQILAGLFEQAISYLYAFSYVDAVHFAIGLEYYGLLRPADPWTTADTLLSFDTRGKPQLSFGRMLGYYTRDFRAADVESAVEYLTLICLNADLEGEAGRQQAELCHVALRELILETREFSKLIGDIQPNGQRIPGLIEKRSSLISLRDDEDFVRAVTLQAARFADDNGRTTDAVLLYHLAGDYDSVVTIISRAVSEAVSLDIGENPLRLVPVKPRAGDQDAQAPPNSSLSLASIDDPVLLARTMMTMYERDSMFHMQIQDQNKVACHLLLLMSEIKGLVEAGQWPESLDKIRSLEILPLDANGDPARIRHYASKFSGLSQSVAINVPNLLMWTITCCVNQRERLSSGQFSGNEGTRLLMCNNLKQISMDLTTYTSQLRYRFPPHLHEALARASAD